MRQCALWSAASLLGVVVCGVLGCQSSTAELGEDTAQQNAIAEIEKAGGSIERDEEQPDSPVVRVHFYAPNVSSEDLRHLRVLKKLERLSTSGTQITDAGVEHVKALPNLQYLQLGSAQITDKGFEHLKKLAGLETLRFSNTQVTDDGVAEFKQALPNCWVAHE